MPDMDGFKEANNFGFGQSAASSTFHVKGAENLSWGMKDRLSRIFNPKTGKAVLLAFDHGFIMGPTSGLERVDLSIVPLTQYADCLMCTRGILQSSIPATTNKPVCLRSDAGSTILTELNRNVLIDVEDAIRLNASAMAIMFAAGDEEREAITAANLTKAADLGNRYGIPVMGVTAVGKQMARDARYFALASRVCAENGASIVKTYYCEGFERVAATCPHRYRRRQKGAGAGGSSTLPQRHQRWSRWCGYGTQRVPERESPGHDPGRSCGCSRRTDGRARL